MRPFAHPVACCWVLLGVVAQSLKPVKGQQCWELLRPFARSLKTVSSWDQSRSQMPGDYPRNFLVGDVKSEVFDLIWIRISIILISELEIRVHNCVNLQV